MNKNITTMDDRKIKVKSVKNAGAKIFGTTTTKSK